MPPHFPLEEEYQTKEWALATIDTLFSDNAPISFEPCGPINVEYKPSNNNNTYNYASPQHTIVNNTEPTRQTRRAQSALDMNYLNKQYSSLISRPPSTASYASDPVLPYTIPSSLPPANMQRSLSDRLRRRLTPEGSQLKSKLTTYKEKEGVDIWKKTHQEYISNANMIPVSGHSTHLAHFILNELLSTEVTYLKHLMIIKQMFMDPLLQAANSYPRPSVNLKDIQTIFLYIPELIALSSLLVHRLKDTIRTTENGETHGSIGEVFCELEDHFDIYIAYAANFAKQQRCITRADRSIVYRQLVQDSLRRKETNRMGLSDYMISPIQRITRYGLLLKDLAKHSDPSNPDYFYLERSLKCHLALAHAMNEIQ